MHRYNHSAPTKGQRTKKGHYYRTEQNRKETLIYVQVDFFEKEIGHSANIILITKGRYSLLIGKILLRAHAFTCLCFLIESPKQST